jgi:hypothetical protein
MKLAIMMMLVMGVWIASGLAGCAAHSAMPTKEQMAMRNAPGPVESTANVGADEIWILPRPGNSEPAAAALGSGAVSVSGVNTFLSGTANVNEPGAVVRFPLVTAHLAVSIDTFLATAVLTQRFANPLNQVADLEYTFPLPPVCLVTDFQLDIGERRIRGVVVEQAEAMKLYAAARKQGLRATLLTQSSGNVFTASIARVAPGKPIETRMTFLQVLAWEKGEFYWRFPSLGIESATVDLATGGMLGKVITGGPAVRQSRTQHSAHCEFGGMHAAAGEYSLAFGVALPRGEHTLALKEQALGRMWVALLTFPFAKVSPEEWALHVQGEVDGACPAADVRWPTDLPEMVIVCPRTGTRSVRLVSKVWAQEFVLDEVPAAPGRTVSVLFAAGRGAQLRAAGKLEEARKLALEAALVTPETAFITVDATREKHDR